jgi:hypothetical protein
MIGSSGFFPDVRATHCAHIYSCPYDSTNWNTKGDILVTLDSEDDKVLATLTGDLTPENTKVLEAMHTAFAAQYPAWDNRIEVRYISPDEGWKHSAAKRIQ